MHHGTALIHSHQAAWNLLLTSPAAIWITTRPGFTFSCWTGWMMMLLTAHPANLLRQLWCNQWTFLSIPSNHNLLLPDHNLKTNNLMQLVQCTRLMQQDSRLPNRWETIFAPFYRREMVHNLCVLSRTSLWGLSALNCDEQEGHRKVTVRNFSRL